MPDLDEIKQDVHALSQKLDRMSDQISSLVNDLGVGRDRNTFTRINRIESELFRHTTKLESIDLRRMANASDTLVRSLSSVSQDLSAVKNQLQAEQNLSRDIQRSLTVISSNPGFASVSRY
jgi:predicted  nucleic acid-binding Zn-ribbon protein